MAQLPTVQHTGVANSLHCAELRLKQAIVYLILFFPGLFFPSFNHSYFIPLSLPPPPPPSVAFIDFISLIFFFTVLLLTVFIFGGCPVMLLGYSVVASITP